MAKNSGRWSLFRRRKPETDADARERQNVWIKSQMREWQLAWHGLFDADPGQATADNAAKGDAIPSEIGSDFRLIHGFCEVSAETRRACFTLLPQGEELARRFEHFFDSRNVGIPKEDALHLADRLRAKVGDCTVNFEVDWDRISIHEMGEEASADALELDRNVYDLFEGSALEPHPEERLAEIAAGFFITEPMVAAAGNYYQPGQWLEGVYREPAQDECLRLVYQLWLGGWDFLVGSDGCALIPLRHR